MRTPPHLFFVNRPSQVASRTSTCHGHSPNVAPLPPTILPVFMSGLMPHTKEQLHSSHLIFRTMRIRARLFLLFSSAFRLFSLIKNALLSANFARGSLQRKEVEASNTGKSTYSVQFSIIRWDRALLKSNLTVGCYWFMDNKVQNFFFHLECSREIDNRSWQEPVPRLLL